MKKYIKPLFFVAFVGMIAINVLIFVSSIHLSDEINQFEEKIQLLTKENQSLEQNVYTIDSLRYAQKVAPSLNFQPADDPLYLDTSNYALKP